MRDAFKTQIVQVFAANRAFSRAITAAAINAKSSDSFPYFVVPSFEVFAHEARKLSGSEVFMYAPIVEDAPAWSRFATQTSAQWLQESKTIFDALEPGLNRSMEHAPASVSNTIWSISDDGRLWPWKDSGTFVPSLHTSPPPVNDMSVQQNINLFSNENYKTAGLASIHLKGTNVGNGAPCPFPLFPPTHAASHADVAFTRFQSVNRQFSDSIYGVNSQEDEELSKVYHPHSVAAQPVYRAFDGNETVGFIFSIVAWKDYLARLLPANAGSIDVVLRNACGQEATYVLRNGNVRACTL
jgi:hypothetical protein